MQRKEPRSDRFLIDWLELSTLSWASKNRGLWANEVWDGGTHRCIASPNTGGNKNKNNAVWMTPVSVSSETTEMPFLNYFPPFSRSTATNTLDCPLVLLKDLGKKSWTNEKTPLILNMASMPHYNTRLHIERTTPETGDPFSIVGRCPQICDKGHMALLSHSPALLSHPYHSPHYYGSLSHASYKDQFLHLPWSVAMSFQGNLLSQVPYWKCLACTKAVKTVCTKMRQQLFPRISPSIMKEGKIH